MKQFIEYMIEKDGNLQENIPVSSVIGAGTPQNPSMSSDPTAEQDWSLINQIIGRIQSQEVKSSLKEIQDRLLQTMMQ